MCHGTLHRSQILTQFEDPTSVVTIQDFQYPLIFSTCYLVLLPLHGTPLFWNACRLHWIYLFPWNSVILDCMSSPPKSLLSTLLRTYRTLRIYQLTHTVTPLYVYRSVLQFQKLVGQDIYLLLFVSEDFLTFFVVPSVLSHCTIHNIKKKKGLWSHENLVSWTTSWTCTSWSTSSSQSVFSCGLNRQFLKKRTDGQTTGPIVVKNYPYGVKTPSVKTPVTCCKIAPCWSLSCLSPLLILILLELMKNCPLLFFILLNLLCFFDELQDVWDSPTWTRGDFMVTTW